MNVGSFVVPAVVIGAALFMGASATKSRGTKRGHTVVTDMPEPMSGGQADLRYLAEWAGLDAEWIAFLEEAAMRESGFNNLRGLGVPSMFPDWAIPSDASTKVQQNEADAATIGYDRNENLAQCDWPRSRYTFGSGGWFGFLPSTGVAVFRGTRYECIDPWMLFDPATSLVMAMGYGRGLQRWDNFKGKPTWLNLRVGWGNPSNMGEPAAMADVEQKFGDRLEELGYPRSFMYNEVTPLPSDIQDPAGLLDALWEVL